MDVERLKDTLERASGNTTDIYFGLYADYMENESEAVEALKTILEYPKEIGDRKDKNPTNISYQEENRLIGIFEEMITGLTERITELNLTKDDFYKKLYFTIFNSDNELFPQKREEKVIALKILSESVSAVPYFQVIMYTEKISRDEFADGIGRLMENKKIQEATHMLQRQFSTTPEEAAQLLRIEDGIADKKDRIIFWTFLINALRREKD